jgi:hypothetical protein
MAVEEWSGDFKKRCRSRRPGRKKAIPARLCGWRVRAGYSYDKDEDLQLVSQAIVDGKGGQPNTDAKVRKVYFVYLTAAEYETHWK